MNITDLDHSRTGFYTALIVLTIPSVPPMPGMRPLDHPAFLQRRETFRTLWTCLYLDAPASPMLGHPGLQGVIVILLIRKDRLQTRQILGGDMAEQDRCGNPIIETSTGHKDDKQQPERIDQQVPLAAFNFLAPILPALGTAHLGGLDRLTLDARGTGGGLVPRFHTGAFAQGLDQRGPSPIVTPRGTGVIDGALRQHIMGEHIPLAPTA